MSYYAAEGRVFAPRIIRDRLAKITANKTLVLITHRPGLLDLVDRLIVVEDGKIIADGPREAVLRALNGPPSVLKPESGQLSPAAGGQA